MSETDALVKPADGGAADLRGTVKVTFQLGWVYFFASIPTTLIVFTGPKIANDKTMKGFDKVTVSICQTMFWVGFALSSAFVMPICDRVGRKYPLYILHIAGLLAGIMGTCVMTPIAYGLTVFLLGCTNPPTWGISYLLTCESIPARWWSNLTVFWNVGFSLSIIAMAIISERAKDVSWRIETISWYAVSACTVLTAAPCFVHESPKFRKEADASACKVQKAIEDGNTISSQAIAETKAFPLQQLWQFPLRRRMISTIICWVACSLSYYGIAYSAGNLSDNVYANMVFIGCVDLLGYALAQPVIAIFNTFPTQAGSFCFAWVCLVACAFLTPGSVFSPLVICALLGRLAICFAFTTIYILIVECFPEECRSSAMGLANFFARTSSLAAPLLSNLPASVSCPVLGVVSFLAMIATLDLRYAMQVVS